MANPNVNPSGSQTILNSDVDVRGNLKCSSDVFFDGRLEGDLTTDGRLELGENATVRGNLTAVNIVARGKITGNVTARERLEVKARTDVVGDLRAAKLVMDDGVSFLGKADIAPSKLASQGTTHMPKPPDAFKATEIGKPAMR